MADIRKFFKPPGERELRRRALPLHSPHRGYGQQPAVCMHACMHMRVQRSGTRGGPGHIRA